MLRKRDIELIAGLVEGTLEDETEARALLESSQEARSEYEAQSVAVAALRSARTTAMSEVERSDLRREIWTELRNDPSPASRRAPWFYRLAAPVAAALVVVVGVLALLDQGFQASDETADTFAGALSADTTESETSDSPETAQDGATAPADDDTAGGDQAAEELAPEALQPEEFFASVAELVRSDGFTTATRLQRYFADEPQLPSAESCVASAGLTDYTIFGEATNFEPDGTDTRYLVLTRTETEIGPDSEVTFVSIEECEVVHVER